MPEHSYFAAALAFVSPFPEVAQLCAVAMAQEQPAVVIPQSIVGSATYITHV